MTLGSDAATVGTVKLPVAHMLESDAPIAFDAREAVQRTATDRIGAFSHRDGHHAKDIGGVALGAGANDQQFK